MPRILVIFISLFILTQVRGQNVEVTPNDTSHYIELTLFSNPAVSLDTLALEVTLEFDMRLFRRNIYKEEYQDALLRYTTYPDNLVEREVKIRSRGNFRKDYCDFPPIKMKLNKERYEDEELNDLRKLKLVTHCKRSRTYEQYLLKEYLIYKMYNLLTEYSYRSRLLVLHYMDSQGRNDPYTKYGFFLESDASLSNRLNSIEIERKGIGKELTDKDSFIQLAIFQFMIGNSDWAVPALHNIKLFKEDNVFKPEPIAIPYDFDYSGMVNTHYAIPSEMLEIESVTERLYMGYPIPREEYNAYFERFFELKESFYGLVENFHLLEPRQRKQMIRYLDEFYKIIENDALVRLMIVNRANTIN